MQDTNEMLDFVKAFTDADRLRIVGTLSQHPGNIKEIAEGLHMPFKDAAKHIAYMKFVGVVRENEGIYELDTRGMEELARRQFAGQPRESYTPAPDVEEEKRKVLMSYLNPDGSIKQIPHQPVKLKTVLEYLVSAFTPGVVYSEKEVNTIIRRFNVDTAGLRRDLIDAGMLQRESDGSKYWRPEVKNE
jgi:hypothetical protein